jgi:uncharacterized protein involved in exopolysaccharide biosynthesis
MLRLVLLRLLESYFRHRWLNLVPMLLMGALAVVFTLRAPQTYISGGVLFVQNDSLLSTLVPIGDSGWSWSTPAQVTANEIGELLRTEAFVRFAIQRTDLEAQMQGGPEAVERTIWEFREAVSLNVIGEKLVGFGASHEDPEIAHQIATATIDAYTEWKLNSERQESQVAQAFFAEQLGPYQEDLDQARAELQAYLAEHPAPVRGERPEQEQTEIARLQAIVADASQQVKDTLAKEQEARLALSKAESNANQAYSVIDAPKVPTDPSGSLKDLVMQSAIFVILGIGLSGACVVGGMLLDRSFRLLIDVQHGLALPVLATIPLARLSAAQAATEDERRHIVRDYGETALPVHPVAMTSDIQINNGNGRHQPETDTTHLEPATHLSHSQRQSVVNMKDAVNV